MGAVYLVRHPRLPRLDALKLLRRELNDDPGFTQRFLQEADVVAQLSHRNIVSVLDRGEDGGQLWLTMQYVDGTDAETALAQAGGRLPPARAVHIVTEVGAALDAAPRRARRGAARPPPPPPWGPRGPHPAHPPAAGGGGWGGGAGAGVPHRLRHRQ